MYKRILCCLCAVLLILPLSACKDPAIDGQPTETGLPAVESFSDTEYEDYQYHFRPVQKAVYKHDGIEETIAADDPRLIRLLNFLAYSENQMLSIWLQGCVEEAEINTYLASDAPMLDVAFVMEGEPKNDTLGDTPRILVCGDSYLLFIQDGITNNGEKGLVAERYWPYASTIEWTSETGNVSLEGWGTGYWMDILEYAGFQQYYSMNDFEHIVEGKSTYQDVYNIAPPKSVQVTSYGIMCEYPMEDGGCIRMKFYGEESVVGMIEVDLKDTDDLQN